MSEADKMRHLFKGLSPELFSVITPKPPASVHYLISECKCYEELQSERIFQSQF